LDQENRFYLGKFENDKFIDGYGKITDDAEGVTYEGSFMNGKKHGYGEI